MKVLFITCLLVASAFGRSAVQPQQTVQAEGPACPIEDPLQREGPLPINITVDPIIKLELGSQVTNLIVDGLSSLWYDIEINAWLLTARFEVKLTRATGNATYTAEGYLDARPFRQETIPSGNLTGSGFGKVSAENVHLKGSATVFLNFQGKVQVSRLVLDNLSFDSLEIDLGEDLRIGGGAVDWDALNRNLKQNFDQDLRDNKNAIVEKVRGAANGILKNFTLQELIDMLNPPDDGEPCETNP